MVRKLTYRIFIVFIINSGTSLLYGQACCTIQGFNGNSSFGTIFDFDGLNFAENSERTQIQFQFNSSDDWDRNSFIINGPLMGYFASINYFIKPNLLATSAISGNFSSISEELTIGGSESNVSFANLQIRINWFASDFKHSLWARLTAPLYEYYSSGGFPFRTSPLNSIEVGYGHLSHYINQKGKNRVFSIKADIRKDGQSGNLYQFDYYSTLQFLWRYGVYKDLIPFSSVYFKGGALKIQESGVYLSSFDKTHFTYGLIGGGLEYSHSKWSGLVLRIYGFYPIIRWSDLRLPAGFDEKPVLGMTLTKSFSLKNKHLKENP